MAPFAPTLSDRSAKPINIRTATNQVGARPMTLRARFHGCIRKLRHAIVLLAGWTIIAPWTAEAAHWPQFRGPRGSGVAVGDSFPTHFGPDTNLLWKAAIPTGHSSPCVWGDQLFLTAWIDSEFQTLCLDTASGRLQWNRGLTATEVEPTSGLGNPAAPTCCTDGKRVFSYFGSWGIICHDLDGNEVWRRPLPIPVTGHGTGTSPVLAGSNVILLRDADLDSQLLALDALSGEIRWKTARPEFRRGFCTPLVLGDGEEQIIVAPGTLQVVAYRARDGHELWRTTGLPNEVCSSPILAGSLIIAGGWTSGPGVPRMPDFESLLAQGDSDHDGRLTREEAPHGPARQQFHYIDADRDGFLTRAEYGFIAEVFHRSRNAVVAIRPGGSGDVTSSHLAWSQTRGLPYVPTPLFYDGRLYLVKNGGLVTCLDAAHGTTHFLEERLSVLGDNYASPVAADGKICVASRSGTFTVLAAANELQVLARNALEETVLATPAIAAGTLYVRSEKHLWAFREAISARRTGKRE